uniref:Putative disease resistance protein RGA3 n=1 Tax=Populus alba TaxID=43335 RepID=A0A4U5P3S8_POPAL|nr:putative disease resistance protein RGA3 [Populus alba]
MAESILFNIAEEIVKKLGPLATQEIALWWGVKDQLSKLKSTVARIKGVLHDAEEQVQKPAAQLEDWLGKLQEAVYDAEDLLDDFSTEVQRKRLMSRNKISREVRTFFSGSNQLVYGCQMGHKVKELRKRLDEIVSESEKFQFEVRCEEKASLTMIREATTSSEPEIFFGREEEKKKAMSFLLNPNDEIESVSAFGPGQESNYMDEKIKKEIVERCQGVPLVIKAIARLMSMKDRAQWLSFIKQELPHRVKDDNIIDTLKLSYNPLPSYMKHCFAYCSLFPKGHKIDVKSLIRLWIALGFVSSSNLGECLEISGLRCFEDLLWRSFFHEVKRDDLGNIESCKMHDFMHDLATHVAGFQSIKVERGGNSISELTRHVSFDTILDLSQQIPIPLPCAKSLRTLVLFQGGKHDEGAWVSICRDFRRLRVLVLSDFGMKEVATLIEKIKHLKYLDLSNNEMEALSNSITSLVNLQVLKLNSCSNLEELPRDISKLISLRHLDVGCTLDEDLCENLEYMPRGIGKLTSLQTLSYFVVAKKKSPKSEMIGGLDELRMLNELRGRLEIRVKGYEGGSCISEFEVAKLIDKECLQSLTVRWDRELDSDSDIDLYDKMLQSLQPNSSLQELIVKGYGGMRFPSWVSDLSNLVRIRLESCRRLKHIPPLDAIPSLEELSIGGLDDLEYIDSEGVGGKGVPMFFPSLKRLYIYYCDRLKGWSRDEMNDDSDESTIEEGLIMLSFPRLSSLTIRSCPNLTSMPLFPTLDEDLHLSRTSSMPLQQTMKMTSPVSSSSSFTRPLSKLKGLFMWFIDDMESLPEVGLQNLSSLQRLGIYACPGLKSMPLPDQVMHSLQQLEVGRCRELKSLSESESQGMIPYLPSLQRLIIHDCSEEVSGRARGWGKESEEWPNIKHIRDILIDWKYIQKEGSYVKG